jgi:hypothetical protein
MKRGPYKKRSFEERFWSHVSKTSECWNWTGSKLPNGYGHLKRSGERSNVLAHRASYELEYGAIPDELLVCHHCDNPSYVRPSHLFLSTVKGNAEDMVAKGRQQKGEGHYNAKLNDEAVRALRIHGDPSLALKTGAGQKTITEVFRGRGWRHVR